MICKLALAVAMIMAIGAAAFAVGSPSTPSAWPEIHSPKTSRLAASPKDAPAP